MNINEDLIKDLVNQVMNEIKLEKIGSSGEKDYQDNYGIFETMEEAIDAAEVAQKKLAKLSIRDRESFVQIIRNTVLDRENLKLLSRLAVEETGIGNYHDKLLKNTLAAEKTPGTEDLTTSAKSGDYGLTIEEYCAYGVIGAITPTTNPTETIICNSIGMIAGGNSVVFSPHPRAKDVSIKLVMILNKALEKIGAPKNLIVTVKEPSIENTTTMMHHDKIRMLVATGGPGIVKMVMSTGKKAIGAGAGNPPVVVDETADIEKAAIDIIKGASFDNNVPCIAEKEVIVVQDVADYLINNMKNNGGYQLKDAKKIKELLSVVTKDNGEPKPEFVGKSAKYILDKIGIRAEEEIKVIIMETEKDHPFVMNELMMPILAIVRVKDVDEAIDLALITEKGNRHTAIMHSKNVDKLTKMAKVLQTTIFVKNAPSYAGLGFQGEGFASFTIAGPTGEGLTSARAFCRRRRCVMSDALHIR